jgi:hypothetical protein
MLSGEMDWGNIATFLDFCYAVQATEMRYGRYYGMPLTSVLARNETEEKQLKMCVPSLHCLVSFGEATLKLGNHVFPMFCKSVIVSSRTYRFYHMSLKHNFCLVHMKIFFV